jgi:hypothetical protein
MSISRTAQRQGEKNDGRPSVAARRFIIRFRCEKEKQLIGEKNGINDVNHAIRLVDVRNGNSGHAALFVG